MEKSKDEKKSIWQKKAKEIIRTTKLKAPTKWMEDIAEKYGIEADTVLAFFNSFNYNHARRQTKRQRTEEFFDLYFEGVKEGK